MVICCALVVALVAAATAPAAPRGARVWRGKSAQKLTVRVRRARGRTTFTYQATMQCTDGTTFTDGTFADDVVVRRHRFRDRYASDGGAVNTTLNGSLRGRRASGQLRVIERYGPTPDAQGFLPLDPKGSVVCDSGTVKWTARRRK